MHTHGAECPAQDIHGASAAARAAARATQLESRALEAEESGDGTLIAAAVKAKREACSLAPFDVLCPVQLGRLIRLGASPAEISYAAHAGVIDGKSAIQTATLLGDAADRLERVQGLGLLPPALFSVATNRYADELLDLAVALAPVDAAMAVEFQQRARSMLARSVAADPDGHNTKAQVSWAMAKFGTAGAKPSVGATRDALNGLQAALTDLEQAAGGYWYRMLDHGGGGGGSGSAPDAVAQLQQQVAQTLELLARRLRTLEAQDGAEL
jgi:hypothetical protein